MLPVLTSIFVLFTVCFLGTEDNIYGNPQQIRAICHTVEYINLYSICLTSLKQIYLIWCGFDCASSL